MFTVETTRSLSLEFCPSCVAIWTLYLNFCAAKVKMLMRRVRCVRTSCPLSVGGRLGRTSSGHAHV